MHAWAMNRTILPHDILINYTPYIRNVIFNIKYRKSVMHVSISEIDILTNPEIY